MNLLEETLDFINLIEKDSREIVYIGSSKTDHSCDWDSFAELADFEYDCGYGSQKIATDLIIVFDDGSYMNRFEYDGAESWEYHTTPKLPETSSKIQTLGGDSFMWSSLEEMNEGVGTIIEIDKTQKSSLNDDQLPTLGSCLNYNIKNCPDV